MKMLTEEFIVLELTEKDFECKDGVTRHYYNIKCGSSDYENITFSVKQDVFTAVKKSDLELKAADPDSKATVQFHGHFGGLKNPFWGIDKIYKLNGKIFKDKKDE